jgi:mono/diheme cytochrome c family protein
VRATLIIGGAMLLLLARGGMLESARAQQPAEDERVTEKAGPGMQGESMGKKPDGDPAQGDKSDLGIGPIKKVTLGPLDEKMAAKGKELFQVHCSMCHHLDERKIGPALRDVTQQRTPEFIMNMVLNTSDMERHDPTAKRLEAGYPVKMPATNLDEKQARELLEYLRSVTK